MIFCDSCAFLRPTSGQLYTGTICTWPFTSWGALDAAELNSSGSQAGIVVLHVSSFAMMVSRVLIVNDTRHLTEV
jgi:hypothetical protein